MPNSLVSWWVLLRQDNTHDGVWCVAGVQVGRHVGDVPGNVGLAYPPDKEVHRLIVTQNPTSTILRSEEW